MPRGQPSHLPSSNLQPMTDGHGPLALEWDHLVVSFALHSDLGSGQSQTPNETISLLSPIPHSMVFPSFSFF